MNSEDNCVNKQKSVKQLLYVTNPISKTIFNATKVSSNFLELVGICQ